ncbi:TRAP transporter large permease subunit [Chloroflexota bacterium]
MSIGIITILMFAALFLFLILGVPLSFVLGSIAVLATFFFWGPNALSMIAGQTFRAMNMFSLVAIPLFVFMANVLERSGVADDLYDAIHQWMGPVKGGLAMGTVVICTVFAAMSGVSAAATISMGLIALPSMLKRGYDKSISIGCIMAGGALGVLIPPSITFILFGLFAAQSVGKLFAGGVFPGLLLATLFIIYIGVRSYFQPNIGPAVPPKDRFSWKQKFISLRFVALPALLVLAVLGSIFAGIATPTESAAVGALGAIICAAINRRLNRKLISGSLIKTFLLNAQIAWIVIGAMAFASAYTAIGGTKLVESLILGLGVNRWVIMILMQLSLIILGCFLDPGGILMITIPVYMPIIQTLGFDPIWFGVLFVINMQTGYLTPPFGFNLFIMKSVVPPGVTMGDIYRSVAPYVVLQIVGLAIVMAFPQIALWLPSVVF